MDKDNLNLNQIQQCQDFRLDDELSNIVVIVNVLNKPV